MIGLILTLVTSFTIFGLGAAALQNALARRPILVRVDDGTRGRNRNLDVG
jgi:hypothetical protein